MKFFGRKEEKLKKAFESIKDEFSDHLEAINANTNEIQSNYEQLCDLDIKIEKLNERIDEVQLMLSQLISEREIRVTHRTEEYHIGRLTKREKEIFLLIYELEEKGQTTYEELAKKGGYTSSLMMAYVANLVAKGIPIQKRYVNNTAMLSLEPKFKEYQTKHNIVDINAEISEKVRDNAQ
ncbi:hypothetical protein H6504_00205 [Candidatus Woesearchaeota archaeon]|nr:hypothetical protein [Candidatus Woesearchaeota archaeon]